MPNLTNGLFTLLVTLTLLLGLALGSSIGFWVGNKSGEAEYSSKLDYYKNVTYSACKARSGLEPQAARRFCEYTLSLDKKD